MTREDVFDLIKLERAHQDSKFGQYGSFHRKTDSQKISTLLEELGEAAQANNDGDWHNMLAEVVQVAACAVAWLETVDVNNVPIR